MLQSLLPVPAQSAQVAKLPTLHQPQIGAGEKDDAGNEVQSSHHQIGYTHEKISAADPRVGCQYQPLRRKSQTSTCASTAESTCKHIRHPKSTRNVLKSDQVAEPAFQRESA